MITQSHHRDGLAKKVQSDGWSVIRSPTKKLDGKEGIDIVAMKNGRIAMFKIVICESAFRRLEVDKESNILNRYVNNSVGGMYDQGSFSREHIDAYIALGMKIDGKIQRWRFTEPTRDVIRQNDTLMELHEVLQ